MIELIRGNLLEADVEAVVNTVNSVGVMGKGIALQFKKAYPENFESYKKACDAGVVVPGKMHVFKQPSLTNPRYIINFPTKRHWRGKSTIEDIESGLDALVEEVQRLGIRSIALPPLGCGLGGLQWKDVLPLITRVLEAESSVRWLIYEPAGAPSPSAMKNRTERPRMTKGRAAVLGLIDRYLVPGFDYPISLLEIQKLIYLLVEAGEPMPRVKFVKHHYGPYADALRHVLERMDGHFIKGYGDGGNAPETPITLRSEAVAKAKNFLESHPETKSRFERVAKLIEGFETPFGMELLSTVHWVSTREDAHTEGEVTKSIHEWSPRKASLINQEHVTVALKRLRESGWIDPPRAESA